MPQHIIYPHWYETPEAIEANKNIAILSGCADMWLLEQRLQDFDPDSLEYRRLKYFTDVIIEAALKNAEA